MQPTPCAFPEPVRWQSAIRAAAPIAAPQVLTDLSFPRFDVAGLRRAATVLAPTCDAVLLGDHQDRADFPPSLLAAVTLDCGAVPWLTLACRDRNRIVLEQDLRGLQQVGANTVLCVTGDGRAYDVRPEVTQVFDLDGTRLAQLAASIGLAAAVAETPSAPPRAGRALRLVQKQSAGASAAVLNHLPRPVEVARFVRDARAAGLRIPIIAAVAVYTDQPSAAALQGLPGLELDAATVEEIVRAADPVAAGIEAAVREGQALLAIDGVAGVNLSGHGSGAGFAIATEIKAEIGRRLRRGIAS